MLHRSVDSLHANRKEIKGQLRACLFFIYKITPIIPKLKFSARGIVVAYYNPHPDADYLRVLMAVANKLTLGNKLRLFHNLRPALFASYRGSSPFIAPPQYLGICAPTGIYPHH